MKIVFSIFLIICLCLSGSQARATPANPFFVQHYDNQNGLSNSSINSIYKDASNLIWVATWDGLNLYDGYSFHVFNYSRENDFKTIGSNVIQQITEDGKGNIWVSTIEGVSRYEKKTGRFYNYFYDRSRGSKISEQEYSIAVDHTGKLYCLTETDGLNYYDPKTDSFKKSTFLQSNKGISKIYFDELNQLWVLHADGSLEVYDTGVKPFAKKQSFKQKNRITNFFHLNKRTFFSTTDNQLYVVNNNGQDSEPVLKLKHALSSMIFYKDHYILAWATKGYDVYSAKFTSAALLEDQVNKMKDIKITSMTLGSEDILWFGTDGNGLIKIFPKTKSFATITTSDNGMPYNKSVRAFCEVDNHLWVGTKGGGIMELQDFWSGSKTLENRNYFVAPAELENNSVYALLKGKDDLVYIGSDAQGIGVYDLKRKKFFKWQHILNGENYPSFGSVYAIRQDKDSSLWLGTSGYGLVHLKLKKNKEGSLEVVSLKRFTYHSNGSGPANDIIYALAEGENNQLWIGCRYGGLSLLDKKTLRFTTFKAFTYEGSLSNNDVLSLYKDSYNKLWIGTSYGLNWISLADASKKTPVFQKLNTSNGLPNNTIHAIQEDSKGQIWVSTNKGLAKVNQADLKISYYQQADGLQSNEFSDGAVWKDSTGRLFFGGTYGFNYFLPQDIRKSELKPNLLISDILMGGKNNSENGLIVVPPGKYKPLVYAINRKDNFFELDLKAISYLNAEKCEYAYFLEGYDKIWHYAGTNGKIIYSNLYPGQYKLKIKWSNGEGTWTEEVALFSLKVNNYFWLTPIAITFYIILLAVIGYIIYKYRKNKLEIKHQLEVEHLLRTKEEEIHQNRLGFFTNIAHELQTPLTLIMGSAEHFLDKNVSVKELKERPYFLSVIHQQASRLTYLVQQLLEFRKVEEGFYKNNFSFLNISELFQNLTDPFRSLSEKNKMEYEVHISQDMYGWVDKDKVEKIVFNLLSNAFKHSSKNEQVFFSAIEYKTEQQLEIKVVNSGSMPEEKLEKLFEKFYGEDISKTREGKFGTGIGLAFTKQLVSLLGGRIMAGCENERIHFVVNLPLSSQQPETGDAAIMPSASDKPSYLYKTITSYTEQPFQQVPDSNNKQAIIETLQESKKKNILIVEDDADIRFLIRDILREDYIVYEAPEAKKAIELMDKMLPDLIICDVMMPGMSGLEFCNKIKNTQSTCQIPMIILSARGSEDHHMEGYEVGADAYIAKPFHTSHLKLRVRKLLEYRQKMMDVFQTDSVSEVLVDSDLADTDKVFLSKLVKTIEERLADGDLNAVLLEKEFSLSKMQLYRKLKTMTGMTPGEFIKHIRLKEAARLLTTTNLTVTEIFFRTGFNNQSYFFREFRKQFQCAPNEYREQKLKKIEE